MVYGSPSYQKQKSLCNTVEMTNEAWAIVGDFNTILNSHDPSGVSTNPSWRGAQDFQRMIQEYDLVDAGF